MNFESIPENYSSAQLVRLRFIDFRLFFTGCVRRSDLMQRFGLAEAAATRDLAAFREASPGSIEYDGTQKAYSITESYSRTFIKGIQAKDLLRALVHGMGDDFGGSHEPLISCELPSRLHRPNIEIVSIVSRAIYAGHVIEVDYLSSRTAKRRRIVPFTMVGNGLRWHVRAFDRIEGEFRDFVINRILQANALPDEPVPSEERKDFDKQWNRIVELELIPHPAISKPRYVEVEHGMVDGVLRHEVRAALAGYVLRLWNVDCSKDASLRGEGYGSEYQLRLRNRVTLYGVKGLEIAPGFSPEDLA